MAGLSPTAIADFIETTNEATEQGRYQDITQEYQQHEFVFRVAQQKGRKKRKGRPVVVGAGIQWFIGVNEGAEMEETALYAPTTGTNVDHTKSLTVQMAMGRSHWQYDDREAAMQGTSYTQMLDYLSVREDYAKRSYAVGMENKMWVGASQSSADPPNFIRLTDWIVKGSTSAFSFGGGNPSGWSGGLGGKSRTTYEGLRNGTGRFTVMNDTDLFSLWEEAARKCYFISPISYSALDDGAPDHVYYTGNQNIKDYKTYLTQSNDNLLIDAGRYRGMNKFQGSPVCWVPALDADADRPIYGQNWGQCEWVELPGYSFKRNRPMPVGSHQEHVWRVTNNWIGQWIMYNPRSTFVLHYTT